MKILDCTLRDGGYYNNWDFDDELVKRYLDAMDDAKIDAVELGFRYARREGFLGQYAYLGDQKLNELMSDKYNFELAVMIEEGDISSHHSGSEDFIKHYFTNKSKSHVDLVRIAVHFEKLENIIPATKMLKDYGYNIAVNIMQISRIDRDKVIEKLTFLSNIPSIDILYFADSLGDMGGEDVKSICEIYSKFWGKQFGFHGHNNCGKAVQNSLIASQNGCEYIDSTVTGMGRGAGNTLTEIFLLESKRVTVESMPKLAKLVLDDFAPMRKLYGWGDSLTYYIAAKGHVHPTYVQTLETERSDLHMSEVAEILTKLSYRDASSFKQSMLTEVLYSNQNQQEAGQALKEKFSGNKILLLGPGLSLGKHLTAVRNFVTEEKIPVASCSVAIDLDSLPISYFICSSPRVEKFITSSNFENREFIAVTPWEDDFNQTGLEHVRYQLFYKPDALVIDDNYCMLGSSKSLIYAIACCISVGFEEIVLAGFDGYGGNDVRTIEMSHWLDRIQSNFKISLTSILHTAYPIRIDSVYSNYV